MPAIRTVFEDEDTHVIEGLLYPFSGPFPGGKDSYGTAFSARTNFYWELYPDRSPTDGEDVPARFVRPVTYQHGFDTTVGLSRIGGYSPVRQDKKGVWIQAQLDKHHQYYDELRALLGEDALGFSGESSEHAVRIKGGEVREWPAGPASVTPTPSNPFAVIAARAADINDLVVRVTGMRATDKKGKAIGPPEGGKAREDIPAEDFAGKNKSYPIVTPGSVSDAASSIGRAGPDNYSTDELKANIIKIAKRKGASFVAELPDSWKKEAGLDGSRSAAFRTASDDAACAMSIKEQIVVLMGCEADEPAQLASLQKALDAMGDFVTAEVAEIGKDGDEPQPVPYGYMSALRQGRRNSSGDLGLIDGIHDATVALGTTSHSGEANDDRSPDADAGRSAKTLPIRVTGMERVGTPKSVRKALRKAIKKASRTGSQVGEAEVRRLVGPMI